jgi:transposase
MEYMPSNLQDTPMKKAYLGLDVHKASIVIAIALADGTPPVLYGKSPGDQNGFLRALRRALKKHELEKDDVKLCYEAGPTGFVLARRLLEMGYDTRVVAPSLVPIRAGERIKTDRRDACKLAGLFRAGELTAVHIPEAHDEVIRDLCRARTDAVDQQTRCRQQLGAFLLRNGHHYTGLSTWTEAHMRYLRELVMQDPVQKLVLEEYLQRIDAAVQQVSRIEAHLPLRMPDWERAPMVKALEGLRGFQLVAAMTVVSELGDLHRFAHPRQLMAYLGLVPGEYSSGGSRRQGSITKCGNSHVRWLLVEAAHHYRLPPKVSKQLSHRQEELSRAVKELSWRAQNRLHRRFAHLMLRGLHRNKITVAIARELAAFIWELARVVNPSAAEKAA